MRELTRQNVDGTNYEFGEWDVKKSLEIFTWLVKMFGATAVQLVVSSPKGKALDIDAEKAAAGAMMYLLPNLQSEDLQKKMEQIVGEDIIADGKPLVYAIHFKKRIGHMFKVAFHVVRFQYADFLDVLPAGLLKKRGPDSMTLGK